jgi:hypothetical protein
MTEATRRRPLKTWTSFEAERRLPSPYEIVTHGLVHTKGPAAPLAINPESRGNVWLREHRDAIRLAVPDWDGFRDPDALTYTTYVAQQDDQEVYVEGLLEQFDRERHDERLPEEALLLLAKALAPSRYLGHGLQMLSAYIQQLAPGSYIEHCAVFQTADQLRRVQINAYRTTQLARTHPDLGFGTGDRTVWETAEDWQPIRRAVELALIEYDWDSALVVTNLVVKPVADILLLELLAAQATQTGARLDGLLLENLALDAERARRWTGALLDFLFAAEPANRGEVQKLLDGFRPLGREMIAAGAALLTTPSGAPPDEIVVTVQDRWSAFLEPLGLRVS